MWSCGPILPCQALCSWGCWPRQGIERRRRKQSAHDERPAIICATSSPKCGNAVRCSFFPVAIWDRRHATSKKRLIRIRDVRFNSVLLSSPVCQVDSHLGDLEFGSGTFTSFRMTSSPPRIGVCRPLSQGDGAGFLARLNEGPVLRYAGSRSAL